MTRTRTLLAALLSLAAIPAFAHTGHDHSFSLISGLAHPVGGLDHLLAMLAVGLWAATQQGRVRYAAPLTFVLAMLPGAALAAAGVVLPAVEPGVALSVLALGLMVAAGSKLSARIGLPLIAAFAMLHGQAHGAEAPAAALWAYMTGFAVSTALLHSAGLLAGSRLLQSSGNWLRISGGLIAASGVWLLGSTL